MNMTPTVSEKNIHQSDERERERFCLILIKTSAILNEMIYVLPRAILKK